MMLLYFHLVSRWSDIANPFGFNLSEVAFHLDQERKFHAINCVVFFAKAFISSINSEKETIEAIWVMHYVCIRLFISTGLFKDCKLKHDI